MANPKIGDPVCVLAVARQKPLRDDRVWAAWSPAPSGWWLSRHLPDGTADIENVPTRLIVPAPMRLRADRG